MYVVGMVLILAAVTFIPRAFPFAFFKKKIQNRFIQSFLFYVPYAVLSALTFPAIFSVTSNLYLSLIGTGCALTLSFFIKKFYIVSILSVILVYIFSYCFY